MNAQADRHYQRHGAVSGKVGIAPPLERPDFLSLPAMRYQGTYALIVLIAALDIVVTYWMMQLLGAWELNPVAAAVINARGLVGMSLFKFGMIMLVIIIIEVVGRHNDQAGQRLCHAALAISTIPILYAVASLCHIVPPVV